MARITDGPELVRLVAAIAEERRVGVLDVRAEGVTTLLYFSNGKIVFAEEGSLGETLGRILVRDGLLTQEQYAKVIERMTAALVESEQMRFGEAAVELGFLRPEQVHEALGKQMGRKLVKCLQWDSVACAFYDDPEALAQVAPFPSAVMPLLLEGIRRFYDPDRLHRVLSPQSDRYPKARSPSDDVAGRFALGPAEARFVRTLDGTVTVASALERTDLDAVLARQILAALVLTGAVDLAREGAAVVAPAPRVAAPQDPGPPSAPVAVAEPAPAPVAASEPPPPRPTPPPADRARAARDLLAQIAARRATTGSAPPLFDRTGRPAASIPPEDAQRARLEAEQAHQRGRQHVRYGAWPLALEEFRRAVRRCPDMVEYELHAVWADFRVASDERDREALVPHLEELVRQALRSDADMAIAWHVQGQLALRAGDDLRAERAFRAAAAFDPADLEAMRHLRLFASRRKG